MQIADTTSPVQQIPPPSEVRRRLAQIQREQTLLRQLLRLSERVQEERERREVSRA